MAAQEEHRRPRAASASALGPQDGGAAASAPPAPAPPLTYLGLEQLAALNSAGPAKRVPVRPSGAGGARAARAHSGGARAGAARVA